MCLFLSSTYSISKETSLGRRRQAPHPERVGFYSFKPLILDFFSPSDARSPADVLLLSPSDATDPCHNSDFEVNNAQDPLPLLLLAIVGVKPRAPLALTLSVSSLSPSVVRVSHVSVCVSLLLSAEAILHV